MKLNVACGGVRWAGFENSDIAGGDRVIDLNDYPLPYADEVASLIMISHGLASMVGDRPIIDDREALFGEFHRILKPNGWLRIDDNPSRIYREGEEVGDSELYGFPPGRKVPRDQLIYELSRVGFGPIYEPHPLTTLIPGLDAETRAVVTGNHSFHVSFALEAMK